MRKSRALTEIVTKRKEVVKKLQEEAQKDVEVLALYKRIKLVCGEVFINNPDGASKYQVDCYNRLIQNSELLVSLRKELLME